MSLIKTRAVILGRSRLGEADRLVTALTRERGRVTAAARGAMRPRSRLAAALEPFSLVELILFIKRDDQLARISQCDIVASRRSLREDLDKIDAASHLASLVRGVSPENHADAALFDGLDAALDQMDSGPFARIPALMARGRLLGLAGYAPSLVSCVRCRRIPGGTRLFFEAVAGGLLCDDCIDPASDNILAFSRSAAAALEQGSRMPMDRIGRIKLGTADVAALEGILSAYEAVILDKPLPAPIINAART